MSFLAPVIVIVFCSVLLYYLLQDDSNDMNAERFLSELIESKERQGLTPDIRAIIEESYRYFSKNKSSEESVELTCNIPALLFKLMGESQEFTEFLSQEIDQLLLYNRLCRNREEFMKRLNLNTKTINSPEVREDAVLDKKSSSLLTITVSITVLALIIFYGFYLIQNGNTQSALIAKSSRPNFLLYTFLALFAIPGLMWIILVKNRKR